MTRTILSEDQTIGVQIEDDGTVTIATRADSTDMWGPPVRTIEPSDGNLSEVARCGLVEWAWYEVTKGELQLTDEDDLSVTEDGNVALYLWNVAADFIDTVDTDTEDLEVYGRDRGIALRVASALKTLWYGATS